MLHGACLIKLISVRRYLSFFSTNVQTQEKGKGQEEHKICESNPSKHGQPNEEFKDYRRSISGHSKMKLHDSEAVVLLPDLAV